MLRNKDKIFFGISEFYEIVIIKNNGSESYVRDCNPVSDSEPQHKSDKIRPEYSLPYSASRTIPFLERPSTYM